MHAASLVYVAQPSGSFPGVLMYPANATGNVAATASLDGPAGVTVQGIAIDSTGQIYLACFQGAVWTVAVYAAGSTGSAAPVRTFTYTNAGTATAYISGLAVDASGNTYIEDNHSVVWEFAGTASGPANPVRSVNVMPILAPRTPGGIAVDKDGYLYAASQVTSAIPENPPNGWITVLGPNASGSSPTYTSYISQQGYFRGVALDGNGGIYATRNTEAGMPVVDRFARDASDKPVRSTSITSSDPSMLGIRANGIAVDGAGNIYLLSSTQPTGGTTYITVLPAGSTGAATAANFFVPASNIVTAFVAGQYVAVY